MNPAAIVQEATADGLTLVVTSEGTISVTGSGVVVERWQPILAEHKPAIVAALRVAANDARTASPLADPPRRTATAAEAAELRTLIELVLADAPHEWNEIHGIARTDHEAAFVCFRALADEARERAIWGPK